LDDSVKATGKAHSNTCAKTGKVIERAHRQPRHGFHDGFNRKCFKCQAHSDLEVGRWGSIAKSAMNSNRVIKVLLDIQVTGEAQVKIF
jgi:hypothetical protein